MDATELSNILLLFVWAQVVLIPVLGGIWLGIRSEREKQQRLFYATIKVVNNKSMFLRKH